MKISYTLSRKIANHMNREKVISNKELSIYQYCLELFFDQIIFSSSLLFLGFLLHKFIFAFCFVLFFIPLKMCAGGFHMNSRSLCSFTSYFIFFVSIYLPNHLGSLPFSILTLFFELASFGIILLSPVEHLAKPFSSSQRVHLKVSSCFLLLIMNVIYYFLYALSKKIFLVTFFLYVIILLINQIIGIIISYISK